MNRKSIIKKWLFRILSGVVVLGLLAAAYGYYTYRSHGFGRSPVFETEAPVIPPLSRPAVFVFSKTNAFIHKEAIPAAEALFKQLGNKNSWSVYISENGAVHNADDLAKFDVIVWNNVTGDVLNATQQQALKNYLQAGGGWIGLHGAGDSSSSWAWLKDELVGAEFVAHPYPEQFQQATMHIEHNDDPVVAHLGAEWIRIDEWYSFTESPRNKGMQVLATLDESTYTPDFRGKDISMGADHPIIWKHCLGKGRALYSALGHTAESYLEPDYITLLEQAVVWTGNLTGTQCESIPNSSAQVSRH